MLFGESFRAVISLRIAVTLTLSWGMTTRICATILYLLSYVKANLGFQRRDILSITRANKYPMLQMASSSASSNEAPADKIRANQRIELFFASPAQLRERVQLFRGHGYRAFNLVNKSEQDDVRECIKAIREEFPDADICSHYSLKYNKVARKNNDAHVELIQRFLKDCNDADEVLIVSGAHSPRKPRPRWNTVEALRKLRLDKHCQIQRIAVAYNPYLPDSDLQAEEARRLEEKLLTNHVDKVYLQFGTDLERLKSALEKLKNMEEIKKIAGSVFLPTKQLIAQQKFRPWNGVHLSADFLAGPESATSIVVEIMKLYDQYGVEILWEAPGIRSDKDLQLVEKLVSLRNKTSKSAGGSDVLTVPIGTKSGDSSPATKKLKLTPRHKPPRTCLLLFGAHDLRLYDNMAVQNACDNNRVVIPVFLWNPSMIESGGIRAAALEILLKEAVGNLQQALEGSGLELICRNCLTVEQVQNELAGLINETGATAIYYNKDFTPQGRRLEKARRTLVQKKFSHIQLIASQSALLYDIDQVSLTKGFHGGHWGTLMPFYRNCLKQFGPPRRPIPKHKTYAQLQQLQPPERWPRSDNLSMAVLSANHRSWHQPILDKYPKLSHDGALEVLDSFFHSTTSGFRRYESERSRADKDLATSRLSVYLRLGLLSPNVVYWRTHDHPIDDKDKKTFSRRLVWRDLAYYQLRCFPSMSTTPIRVHYQKTEWISGEEERKRFEAWKWGKTGYPIVDAGMRELYETGWMNQSVRMVVASFLVEYLRVNWVKGCEFFHYTLADCDTAINAMMWQNAGKCGIDQWNFVLSPETASQDSSGEYTRKWVPELANLPIAALVHQPWQARDHVLDEAGIVLGETYPHRVVKDLKAERAKGIASTLQMRKDSQKYNNDRGYDIIILPNGERTVVFTKKEYRIDRSGMLRKEQQNANAKLTKTRKGASLGTSRGSKSQSSQKS